jgi:DNA-binding NarL/FixJ family response regulator
MLEQLMAIRLTAENRMEWVLGVFQTIPDPSQDSQYQAYIDQLVDTPPVQLYFDPTRLVGLQLSRQERQLLRLAAQGLPPSRIAERMGLSWGGFVQVAQGLLGRTGRSSLVELLEEGRSPFPVFV